MKMPWTEKEEYVRKILSEKLGIEFEERKVPLRGADKGYRFDLVSPDGSIVGEVKTFIYSITSGKPPFRKIAHASEACWFLTHAEGAKRKILVFTDRSFMRTIRGAGMGKWLRLTVSK